MKIDDFGIILAIKKYGENSAIVKILSKEHGIYSGFVRGALSKKNSAIYQIGNLVEFSWSAKNNDSLGYIRIELVKSFLAEILSDKIKLTCLTGAINMISNNILEREPINQLFEELQNLLNSLTFDSKIFLKKYIQFEILLLQSLGYGIDLSECVATGINKNLAYVSPKSGCAVSFEAGKKYHDKLLKLPQFLLDENQNFNKQDLLEGIKLTEFFIRKYLYPINFPSIRANLTELCQNS